MPDLRMPVRVRPPLGVMALIAGCMQRSGRQSAVGAWVARTFGRWAADSMVERGMRLLEEALEAAQSAGVSRSVAARLLERVYSRPAGDLREEAGAVGVTLLALAHAAGFDADAAEAAEVSRVMAMPGEQIAQRHAAKVAQGIAVPDGHGDAIDPAVRGTTMPA